MIKKRIPRPCEGCGNPFDPRKDSSRYCSTPCTQHARFISAEQFWSRTNRDSGCWLWLGATRGKPGRRYGSTRWQGVITSTHRLAWELTNGPIPDKLQVCHKCDTPLCINPDHLFLGTHQDNMKDRDQKGRTASGDKAGARTMPERFVANVAKGERSGSAKLTANQVIDIRNRYASGTTTYLELAIEHGVDKSAIALIVKRRNWSHI